MPVFEIQDPKTGKVYEMDAPKMPSGAQLEATLIQMRGGTKPPAPKRDAMEAAYDPDTILAIDQGHAAVVGDMARGARASIPFAGYETPDTNAGKIGRAVGEVAQLAIPLKGASMTAKAVLPNTARAGAKFQEVMAAAKNVPIDISEPGNAALRIMQLAERGGTMPKAVRDFVKRVTDPNKPAMVYEEARDFASNISRLSADEFSRLNPVLRRELGTLRVTLNKSVENAARVVGKSEQYLSAMKEYLQAAKVHEVADKVKRYAVPSGVGYYLYNKAAGLASDIVGGN